MIGNDIVDLAQAKRESNWQRSGFLNKLFTACEQQLIHTADDPERMVWLLWSMKESAYKIGMRETGKRVFAPLKLTCHINLLSETTAEGVVFQEKAYQTKSSITTNYITSVATPVTSSPGFHQAVIPLESAIYQRQTIRIRKEIKQYCTDTLAIPESNSSIHKDQQGIPVLCLVNTIGELLTIPISISHHGHYGSFAICTHRLLPMYKF
ncbi:4'-phosphopantetheinyl transferase superfamily protein [Spirosoma migulaei]